MAIRKFDRKTKMSPGGMILWGTVSVLALFVVSVFLIRYFMEKSDPFKDKTDTFSSGLSFSLEMDGERYRPGDPVRLKLKMSNSSGRPVTLDFPNSEEVDFLVYREDDWFLFKVPTLIWKSSVYKKSVAMPHKVLMKPHESKVFTGVWPQVTQGGEKVRPGVYRIVGCVMANDFTVSLTLRGKSEKE